MNPFSPPSQPEDNSDRRSTADWLPPGQGATSSANGDFPPGNLDYEILAKLGQGGMGIVFKARQKGLDRLCALKMILAHKGDEEHLSRFRTEAESIARLQHPNIVQNFRYFP